MVSGCKTTRALFFFPQFCIILVVLSYMRMWFMQMSGYLSWQVHRLPVVDNSEDMRVLGIVTRTDIYVPLLPPVNPLFHQLAGAAPGDSLAGF